MYEIIIKKKTIEDRFCGKNWGIVGEDENGKSVYDYTPEIIKKQVIELEVLRQNVEELDLVAVIKAINGI